MLSFAALQRGRAEPALRHGHDHAVGQAIQRIALRQQAIADGLAIGR
jgi:hypothetical protein